MMRAVVLIVALLGAVRGAATQQPLFKSGVDVVRIDVSVMQGGTPVAGLTAANFPVTDNGIPQALDSVSLDRVPLSLTMVFDTSSSLAGERLSGLISAGNDLVKALRPEDGASLGGRTEGGLPSDLLPDLLRTDERGWMYVGEESGHLVALAPAPRLTLLRSLRS